MRAYSGDLEAALADVERALYLTPTNPHCMLRRAEILLKLEKIELAAVQVEQIEILLENKVLL